MESLNSDRAVEFLRLSQNAIGVPFPVFLGFIAFLWALNLLNFGLLRGSLRHYGITPRQPQGLWGILFAPLLHSDWSHLYHNTPPLLVVGTLVILQVNQYFYGVTVMAWLVGGLGVWIFGEKGVHLGASSLIWGYCGFLLIKALVEPSIVAVTMAAIVVVFYGSWIFTGLGMPAESRGISWQGHQFGLAGGALAVRYSTEIQQFWQMITTSF